MIPARTYLGLEPTHLPGIESLAEVDLSDFEVPISVVELVPESVARELIALPIGLRCGMLVMAMLDPMNWNTASKIQFILNRDVELVRAPREQLIEAIDCHYGQAH